MAKDYSKKSGFDYEETFSLVAMIKSIRILLSISTYYDYEIWKIDAKTTFLNGYLKENIYMMQPDGFITEGQENMVCKLHKSIYGIKQASRSWSKCFDQVIKSFGFDQNEEGPCVYGKMQDDIVVFLILYVDDILLIGNEFEMLLKVKIQLATQFQIKDLGKAQYVLGIKIIRGRKNKIIALSQENYIDSILSKYNMQDSEKGFTPFRYGINLSQDQCPMTAEKKEYMKTVPYASAIGSLMYVMLCTRPDIFYSVGIVSRYQSNPGREHWTAVKHILKYLRRARDYMLVYHGNELAPIGYTDSNFQLDADLRKSTSRYVFTLGGAAVSWRSIKQSCIADSTMEAEYVATSEAAKEAIWLRKFLMELGVIAKAIDPMILYSDNSGAIAQAKEPRNHRKGKHIERKYHLVREIVQRGDIIVENIASEDNLAYPFTKTLKTKVFDSQVYNIGLRCTL